MGESVSPWIPPCHGSIRVELGQRTTSDSGALLLREALDSSGVIDALEDTLVDPRHPLRLRLELTGKPTSSLLVHEHLHCLHYEAYRGVRSNWTTSYRS